MTTTAGWTDPRTTYHAEVRLLQRYGLTHGPWRRLLMRAHADAIMSEEAWLMGLTNDGKEVYEVRGDGACYYPVWNQSFGPIVTYLTPRQAHLSTGWLFLL